MRVHVIADLISLQGDPGGLAGKLAGYPRDTVIPAAGSWLGQFNAGYATPAEMTQNGKLENGSCGTPLGEILDAGLYLGQPAELTESWPNPAIFLDPSYWAELQRRNSLASNITDLDNHRQEHPPAYPPLPAAAC